MPKRRANGEGNIRKRKDGRWEGRYTVGHDPETGKAVIKNVLGKTQAEVKEKLKKAIEKNVGIDYGRAKTYTVGNWLEVWHENYAKIKMRPSTYLTYHGYIENHIKPQLGSIPLNDLTTLHLISEGQSVDSLFLKLHPHAEQFQLPDIFQRLLGVSGEAGDGFGDDQVDLVLFAHLDHSLEFGAVLCVHARQPFVSEYLHQLPLFFSLNEAGIDPNLVGVGVLLISRIGRYPAIGGDSNFADFLPGDGRDEFDLRHQQNPLSG